MSRRLFVMSIGPYYTRGRGIQAFPPGLRSAQHGGPAAQSCTEDGPDHDDGQGWKATSATEVDDWTHEVKAQPGSTAIGMILAHQGIVRGTSRSGEPVRGMLLRTDGDRLESALAEARTWPGVFAVRGWVNEGSLAVGDDIMKVLVAGDVRDNVSAALQRLVSLVKTDVLLESELR